MVNNNASVQTVDEEEHLGLLADILLELALDEGQNEATS